MDIPTEAAAAYGAVGRLTMPRISYFLGITIVMHYDDHPPPHFHVWYGDARGTMAIETMQLTNGYLPPRVLGLLTEWGVRHRALLLDNFRAVLEHRAPQPVPPLE